MMLTCIYRLGYANLAAEKSVAEIDTSQIQGVSAPTEVMRYFFAYLQGIEIISILYIMAKCLGLLRQVVPCSDSINHEHFATFKLILNSGGYPNIQGNQAMCILTPVIFNSDTIYLIEKDNEAYTPMKPIVENMGLSWQGQHAKLNEKWKSTIKEILIVAEDGKKRPMICLPIRKLHGWLYSISPNKCKPELRPKIIQYQNECDDVLWQYWTNSHDKKQSPKTNKTPFRQGVRQRFLFSITDGSTSVEPLDDSVVLVDSKNIRSMVSYFLPDHIVVDTKEYAIVERKNIL